MKKCKKCLVEKESIEFYSHPLTKDLLMAKCKECIKEERSSEEGRIKARERDKARDKNPKRKEQKKRTLISFRTRFPEKWRAQQDVSNFLRYHLELKPKVSTISGEGGLIHLHHVDYSKPNEVIPCTPREHRALHAGIIPEKPEYIISLPF